MNAYEKRDQVILNDASVELVSETNVRYGRCVFGGE